MTRDQWVAAAYALSFWLMGVVGVLGGMWLQWWLDRE